MNIYAAIAKNCMPRITSNFYIILKTLMESDDQLVIYENNSTDGTREFLLDMEKLYDNFHYIYKDVENLPIFQPVAIKERADYLAACRNEYLNYIRNNFKNDDVDYLIVFDADISIFKVENFETMFTEHAAVGSNGLDIWLASNDGNQPVWNACQYDTWSRLMLDSDKVHYGQDLIGPEPKNGLKEVRSVFGAVAVYKWNLIKDCQYSWFETGDHPGGLCEHGGLCADIRNKGGKVYINTEYTPVRNKIP